jgi:enoyl-CoA hydratase/carnithine racemase
VKSTREDPSIACIVVTGAGDKSFSAGGDFYAMKRLNWINARCGTTACRASR